MNATAQPLDIAVIGAGAAGVGLGVVLKALGVQRFALLERSSVGASFAMWPEETRFISPSFTSNGFGLLDLNAVALNTSPAFSLGVEHPSGVDYARYLQLLAEHYALPVWTRTDVRALRPEDGGFVLETSAGSIRSAFVVWAAGEFQYPHLQPFAGAEHCLHSSSVRAWRDVEGDDLIIIGGFESGIDAAIHLSMGGKRVRVLEKNPLWNALSSDPSLVLSPYSRERLGAALATGRLELVEGAEVLEVRRAGGCFAVRCASGESYTSRTQPVLASGFRGSLGLVAELFKRREDGHVLLSDADESTLTPGLFVAGPGVRHGKQALCFVYKFRQRFAVVAEAIGARLGLDLGKARALPPGRHVVGRPLLLRRGMRVLEAPALPSPLPALTVVVGKESRSSSRR